MPVARVMVGEVLLLLKRQSEHRFGADDDAVIEL